MKIKKIFNSRIFIGIVSVLIAVALWVYVVNVNNIETEVTIKNVPVLYEGEAALMENRSLMVSEEERAETVSIRLTATRSDINKLNTDELSVTVDLSGIRGAGQYSMPYTIEYPSGVSEKSYDTTANHSYLDVTVYKVVTREFEVRGELVGSVADGYVGTGFTFTPGDVSLTGPEELLSSVSHALVSISRTDLTATQEGTAAFTLIGVDGEPVESQLITSPSAEIEYTYTVLMEKTLVLDVGLIEGGGLNSKNTTYEISPQTILVNGDAAALGDKNTVILDTISLANAEDGQVFTFSIALENGITNVSGETTATVTLRTVGVEERIMYVSNFRQENIPDGYRAELRNVGLNIRFRGSAEAISKLSADDVTIVVDLANIGQVTGSYYLDARIEISGGVDVGVMGDNIVAVYITEDTGG